MTTPAFSRGRAAFPLRGGRLPALRMPVRPFRPSASDAPPAGRGCLSRGDTARTSHLRRKTTAVFRLAGLLCLLLNLLAAAPLRAEEFRRFNVLIPYGWQVTEPSEAMLIIRPPAGDAAAVIISAVLPDNGTARDVLEEYVRYFSASEPQQRKDDSHIFSFMRKNMRHTALFLHDARCTLLLILSDPGNRYPECLDMLMNSLALREDDAAAP